MPSPLTKSGRQVRLTKPRIEAIIDALNFVLADDWDYNSHEHPQYVAKDALLWAEQELERREAREARNG